MAPDITMAWEAALALGRCRISVFLYRGYRGIVEKKMDTRGIIGIWIIGYIGVMLGQWKRKWKLQ